MTNPSRGELVPGGLAMIIASNKRPEHIGVIVELIRKVGPGEIAPHPCDGNLRPVQLKSSIHAWLVKSDRIVSASHTNGDTERVGWGFFREENLMPINPEPDPLQIEEQQEQSA